MTSSRPSLRALLSCMATLALSACFGSDGSPAGPIEVWRDSVVGSDGGSDESDDSEDTDDGEDPDDSEDPDDAHDPDASDGSDCTAALVANKEVRAKLNICRSCHIAKGIAAKSSFLLAKDPAMDGANLRAAFDEVGFDLLSMPAEENGLKHPGGKRLVKGTAAYTAWKAMLDAFDDPAACSASR